MASEVVKKYIGERYDRWLDHAKYFSSLSGMESEAGDILNEVICMFLEKEDTFINQLFESKRDKYTELDFYILKMIRINIFSPTSPYQHKYKPIPADENVNWRTIDLIEDNYEEKDSSDELLKKFHLVREIFESIKLSEKEREIFSFRFFEDRPFSEWYGCESKRFLYKKFKKVCNLISRKLQTLT